MTIIDQEQHGTLSEAQLSLDGVVTRDTRGDLTRRLLDEAASADPSERDRLLDEVVLANRRVAEALAHRYRNRGVDEEDLRQVAYEGLVRAVHRYDPSRSTDLLTYAVPVIRGSIQRHFRDRCWDVRPPRRIQALQRELTAAIDRLRSETGSEPTRDEICLKLGITSAQLSEVESAFGSFNADSIDREVIHGSGLTLADVLAGDDGDTRAAEARILLAPALRELDERGRRILYLRFFEDRTQREIGEEIGITQMHVSRLLNQITATLRDAVAGSDS